MRAERILISFYLDMWSPLEYQFGWFDQSESELPILFKGEYVQVLFLLLFLLSLCLTSKIHKLSIGI